MEKVIIYQRPLILLSEGLDNTTDLKDVILEYDK